MKPVRHNPMSIATLRALCIDMINKANSGHPGMALDAAPIMYAFSTKGSFWFAAGNAIVTAAANDKMLMKDYQ